MKRLKRQNGADFFLERSQEMKRVVNAKTPQVPPVHVRGFLESCLVVYILCT